MPIQLKYGTYSQEYIKKIKYTYSDYFEEYFSLENNYLVPDFDDEGNIKSSFAFINYFQTHYAACKIAYDPISLKQKITDYKFKMLEKRLG